MTEYDNYIIVTNTPHEPLHEIFRKRNECDYFIYIDDLPNVDEINDKTLIIFENILFFRVDHEYKILKYLKKVKECLDDGEECKFSCIFTVDYFSFIPEETKRLITEYLLYDSVYYSREEFRNVFRNIDFKLLRYLLYNLKKYEYLNIKQIKDDHWKIVQSDNDYDLKEQIIKY